MITTDENETRLMYLLRVAIAYVEANPYSMIEYDETGCDGGCLAEELQDELKHLKYENDKLHGII